MKKIKIFLMTCLLVMNANAAFAGFALNCKYQLDETASVNHHADNTNLNYHLAVYGENSFECKGMGKLKDKKYIVYFEGVGVGMSIGAHENMIMFCPTVRKSRVEQDYVSLRLSAAWEVGAEVGVAFNKGFGSCFFTGLQFFSVGAMVEGAKMKIVALNSGKVH